MSCSLLAPASLYISEYQGNRRSIVCKKDGKKVMDYNVCVHVHVHACTVHGNGDNLLIGMCILLHVQYCTHTLYWVEDHSQMYMLYIVLG